MADSVRKLDLMLDPDLKVFPSPHIPSTLDSIRERLIHLEYVNICLENESIRIPDECLIALFKSLSRLKYLSLPILCLNLPIIVALSGHPRLQAINCDLEPPFVLHTHQVSSRPTLCSDEPLDVGAFPSLKIIQFSIGKIMHATSFLTMPHFPLRNLASLWIHVRSAPSSKSVEIFLEDLVPTSPLLEELSLAFHRIIYSASKNNFDTIPHLHIHHLFPFLRFPRLNSFTVTHPYPIQMTDADVIKIATNSPLLEVLSLNPIPIVTAPTTLTLGSLLPLALHCPSLRKVGLYLDASVSIPLPAINRLNTSSMELSLGRSPLSTTVDAAVTTYPSIAEYLASFLSHSSTWTWPDAERYTAEVKKPEEWLPAFATDYHDWEEYERGWKVIEAMTHLILKDRALMKDVNDAMVPGSCASPSGEENIDAGSDRNGEAAMMVLEENDRLRMQLLELQSKYDILVQKQDPDA